jgi:hypothetical protein
LWGSCFSILLVTTLQAQTSPIKWGKVSKEDMLLKVCPFDSAAIAVVLADYGKISIGNGNVLIERHRRIKILDRKALEYANVVIPYYVKEDMEKVTSLHAQTLNVGAAGKLIASEVEGKQIFEADAEKNWREKRFTFPNVEVGSIIEYRYTTISKNFTFLDDWMFQSDIPTIYSEITTVIPEGLDYNVLIQGRQLIKKYPQVAGNKWTLSNLPALIQEPYVGNYHDYAEKIQFQLAGYKKGTTAVGTSGGYETVMTTWEKLSEEILTDERYTRYLNRHGVAKDILAVLVKGTEPELSRMQKIYNHVARSIKWDEKHRLLTDQTLNSLLEVKQGSSAEINLYLTLLLREAGLSANPAMVSTRQHGKVLATYPLLSQFNHLVCHVKVEGKDYLLDATDPLRPYTHLPVSGLNGTAFVLNKEKPFWTKINPAPTKQTIAADVDMTNPGKPVYKFSVRFEGYKALEKRHLFIDRDKKALAKELVGIEQKEFKLVSSEVQHAEEPDEAMLLSLVYEPEQEEETKPSLVYFNPILLNEFTQNPFRQESRWLPIELDYPATYTYILNLKIPAGYQVQEMPKSLIMKFPEELAEFRYQINQKGDLIQLLTVVAFKGAVISSEYYKHLREFHDQIISQYKEMIVLKKQ